MMGMVEALRKARKRQMAQQGRDYVVSAKEALFRCRRQCEDDGFPYPPDLAEAERLLQQHLEREKETVE